MYTVTILKVPVNTFTGLITLQKKQNKTKQNTVCHNITTTDALENCI
jgi:hypothetical protein